jgi:hypothetical protein
MPVPHDYPIPAEWQDGRGHPRYLQLLAYMRDLHIRKGGDYSGQERDSLSNLRTSTDLGIPPHVGVLVRISDKWERIKTLVRENRDPLVAEEAITDTMFDAAAYFLLDIILYEEAVDVAAKRPRDTEVVALVEARGAVSGRASGRSGTTLTGTIARTASASGDHPSAGDSTSASGAGPFDIPADPGYMGYGGSRKVQTPHT